MAGVEDFYFRTPYVIGLVMGIVKVVILMHHLTANWEKGLLSCLMLM